MLFGAILYFDKNQAKAIMVKSMMLFGTKFFKLSAENSTPSLCGLVGTMNSVICFRLVSENSFLFSSFGESVGDWFRETRTM